MCEHSTSDVLHPEVLLSFNLVFSLCTYTQRSGLHTLVVLPPLPSAMLDYNLWALFSTISQPCFFFFFFEISNLSFVLRVDNSSMRLQTFFFHWKNHSACTFQKVGLSYFDTRNKFSTIIENEKICKDFALFWGIFPAKLQYKMRKKKKHQRKGLIELQKLPSFPVLLQERDIKCIGEQFDNHLFGDSPIHYSSDNPFISFLYR